MPGQTRTSPPRVRLRIAVSTPAVSEDPAAIRLPAWTKAPEAPGIEGTTLASTPCVNVGTEGGWGGGFSASSLGCRRIINLLPLASQEYLIGFSRSMTTRVTGGDFSNWSTLTALTSSLLTA